MACSLPGFSVSAERFGPGRFGAAGPAWHLCFVSAPLLLVVEDDRALGAMLAELFTGEGYRVDTAFDAQQGMHRALSADYDAMVDVDRGLPVMDGTAVALLARAESPPGVDADRPRLGAGPGRGLDAGAQDYLVKPFEIAELLARVRNCCWRNEDAATVLQAGGLRLDLLTRRVSRRHWTTRSNSPTGKAPCCRR